MKTLLRFLFAILFLITPVFTADGETSTDPPPHVIVVGGFSRTQGAIPFTEGLTIGKAILLSGGIADIAPARVFLIRNAKSTKVAIRDILKEQNVDKGMLLQPWDIIYIR